MDKKLLVYAYYSVLLLIFGMRQTSASEPAMIMRLVFLCAVFAPVLVVRGVSYPAIITMFLSLTTSGMNYSYMPYTMWL